MGKIKKIFEETNWESLNENEKKIVSKYFLVEKEKRDQYLTDEEQDNFNYYKIYNFISDDMMDKVNIFNPPFSLDYKKDLKVRLYPDYFIEKNGLLTKVIYYEKLNTWKDELGFTQYDFENPILEYTAEYTFNEDSYLDERVVTRCWYKLDGTLDEENSKISLKVYDAFQSRSEGRRRRQNLINQLILDTVGLIIMTSEDLSTVTEAESDALPFLKETSSGISDYYEYGSKEDVNGDPALLIQQVQGSEFPRLDNIIDENGTTIRDFILMRLIGDRIDFQSPAS